MAIQGRGEPGGGWWRAGQSAGGGLWGGDASAAGGVGRKRGVGNAHSGAVHPWRGGVLGRLQQKVTEGRWDAGIVVEEMTGLCPGCWMVTVAGAGQRKELGLEPKPRPMAGNGSEAGGRPVTGMAGVVAEDEFQPMALVCSRGMKKATCGGGGGRRTPVALTPWVLLLCVCGGERSKSAVCAVCGREPACPQGPARFRLRHQ